MAVYKVSSDTSEKEKVIGGVLTAVQGLWLAGAFILTGLFVFLWQLILPPAFAIVLSLPVGIAFGYFFAFKKVSELDYFTYLKYKNNMKKKSKVLINDYNDGTNFDKGSFFD